MTSVEGVHRTLPRDRTLNTPNEGAAPAPRPLVRMAVGALELALLDVCLSVGASLLLWPFADSLPPQIVWRGPTGWLLVGVLRGALQAGFGGGPLQLVAGMRVLGPDGRRPGFARALLRNLIVTYPMFAVAPQCADIVISLGIRGLVSLLDWSIWLGVAGGVLFDRLAHRGLHDWLSGTSVCSGRGAAESPDLPGAGDASVGPARFGLGVGLVVLAGAAAVAAPRARHPDELEVEQALAATIGEGRVRARAACSGGEMTISFIDLEVDTAALCEQVRAVTSDLPTSLLKIQEITRIGPFIELYAPVQCEHLTSASRRGVRKEWGCARP